MIVPEDDPEEEPEEDPEEEFEGDPEEEPEEDPEENPEEDPEEETEEDLEIEPEEDIEEDTEEKLEEGSELGLEDDPDEDLSEEYMSEPCSENETEQNYAAAADLHSNSVMTVAVVGEESGSGKQEKKRKCSRWDQPAEQDQATKTGNGNGKKCKTQWGKKCKTRWDARCSPFKTLRVLHLPVLDGSELDPEVEGLKMRLQEINNKLQSSEVHDDRPEAERSPSPQPVYNNLGIRTNTREVRLRKKLVEERQQIILELIKKNASIKSPPKNKPGRPSKKLYIPVKEYPDYNFVGLILGPKGNTHKRMEKETGAKILLRGKSSVRRHTLADPSENEDLHVYIEADNQKSLKAAVSMVEKLLIPTEEGLMSDHKRAQLEELAKLKTDKVITSCSYCKEPGHLQYACPNRKSTLNTPCDTCGSFRHLTSMCSLAPPPQVSKPLYNIAPNTRGKEINLANLYVGYLPQGVDDDRLRELFCPFGTITQSKVVRDYTTGLSKGHGFVKFDTPNAAALAIMHMNGYLIDGHRLAVRVAGTPPPTTTGTPAMSRLPLYAGPLAALPVVPRQQVLPNGSSLGLPPSLVYMGHNSQFPQTGPAIVHPVVLPGTTQSNTTALSSSGSVAMFPGDPDYRGGSEFMSFPGDPDYCGGSEFKSYFSM